MTDRKENGQFGKGRSGNPSGRPRKLGRSRSTPGYRADVLEVGRMMVSTTNRETGEVEEISMVKAAMMALGRKALSGHAPSAKAFLDKYAEAARINGELTELHFGLLSETARLELENEKLRSMLPQQRGGVVEVSVDPERWARLVGAKVEAWQDRKGSVEPR